MDDLWVNFRFFSRAARRLASISILSSLVSGIFVFGFIDLFEGILLISKEGSSQFMPSKSGKADGRFFRYGFFGGWDGLLTTCPAACLQSDDDGVTAEVAEQLFEFLVVGVDDPLKVGELAFIAAGSLSSFPSSTRRVFGVSSELFFVAVMVMVWLSSTVVDSGRLLGLPTAATSLQMVS